VPPFLFVRLTLAPREKTTSPNLPPDNVALRAAGKSMGAPQARSWARRRPAPCWKPAETTPSSAAPPPRFPQAGTGRREITNPPQLPVTVQHLRDKRPEPGVHHLYERMEGVCGGGGGVRRCAKFFALLGHYGGVYCRFNKGCGKYL